MRDAPAAARKDVLNMKATGIVRRIDYSVIIGAKVRSLENRGFSLIFVQIHQYPNGDEAAITTA